LAEEIIRRADRRNLTHSHTQTVRLQDGGHSLGSASGVIKLFYLRLKREEIVDLKGTSVGRSTSSGRQPQRADGMDINLNHRYTQDLTAGSSQG